MIAAAGLGCTSRGDIAMTFRLVHDDAIRLLLRACREDWNNSTSVNNRIMPVAHRRNIRKWYL